MTLPRNLAFEGDDKRVVPVAPEPDAFFDDEPKPVETSTEERVELFRWICDVLEGPNKSAHVRIAALSRCAGRDVSPLREAARKLNCAPSTLSGAVKAMQKGLKSNTCSEENGQKN
jgi:hypothetical protein